MTTVIPSAAASASTPTPPEAEDANDVSLAQSSVADLAVDDVHVDLPSVSSPPPLAPPLKSPTTKAPRSSFFTASPTKGETLLRVLVASWNVGNAMPPKSREQLHQWIPEGGGGFDVIAIGLQESSYREKTPSSAAVADEGSPSKPKNGVYSTSKATSHADQGDHTEDVEGEGEIEEEDDDEGDDDDDGEMETTPGGQDVAVKKSRTKRSIRKVSKLMRQVSSNLRESVADALDYAFNRQLYQHIGGDRVYALVGKVELMEMRLFVYVLNKHSVRDVEKHTVATGLGSVLGNKGGLIFKMVVSNTSLCFVSCHLAAHQDQKFLDKRNADCASILGASGVGIKHVQPDFQFDHCFWLGDLNYRVDLQYTDPPRTPERTHEQHFGDVLALVRAKKWPQLNANDQLRHQLQQQKALVGWELPPALFAPTFKRERETVDQFNPQRVPSYCDRVLHKSLPALRTNLQCLSFQSVESIGTSDHKPVVARFNVFSTPHILTPTNDANAALGADQKSALSRTTTVEILDLKATDLLGMDLTGKSDPYIKFYSLPEHVIQRDASGSHPSTSTIMNTLSPSWQPDQVPKISLVCDSEADARRVHLVLLLMDYDTTSMDDTLGNVVLSLDKLCFASRPRFVPFDAPVVRHGKPAGVVSGKLRVLLPHQQTLANDAGAGDEVALRMAGCKCSIS